MDLLTVLPEELLELFITYLDGASTLYLGSTCSILHHLTSQPKVWRRLLAKIRTITPEVEKLPKDDLKTIFLLSNCLRNHWGSGLAKLWTLLKIKKLKVSLYWSPSPLLSRKLA